MSPSPEHVFALKDCPVRDRGFCKVAVVTVNAIAEGDGSAIVSVSRPHVIRCGGVPYDLYPDCTTTDDVLNGYAFAKATVPQPGTFPTITIDVLDEADYLARLEDTFGRVDTSFSDEYGDGGPTVIGIKQCGGGWTITWTAALREPGGITERMGGFFEFVTDELGSDTWFTEGLFLMPINTLGDPVTDPDPLDHIACDDPSARWPS